MSAINLEWFSDRSPSTIRLSYTIFLIFFYFCVRPFRNMIDDRAPPKINTLLCNIRFQHNDLLTEIGTRVMMTACLGGWSLRPHCPATWFRIKEFAHFLRNANSWSLCYCYLKRATSLRLPSSTTPVCAPPTIFLGNSGSTNGGGVRLWIALANIYSICNASVILVTARKIACSTCSSLACYELVIIFG